MSLLLAGYVAGRLTGPGPTPGQAATETPQAVRDWMPRADAPGQDIPGLPRYPGSVRVDFDRQGVAGLVVTDVDYLAAAPMPSVQRFYRDSFAPRGWEVLDVSFERAEWAFLLRRGSTEATLEVARRGPLVEVDIEQSHPSALPSLARPSACPTAGPVSSPPERAETDSPRCGSPG
ncbi:MAG TPA: hypothetical protein VHG70_14395 [Nocardioidaceae bacterium]|nr:hypothetical protein [Nocardioidaceae bacterium]